MGRIALFFAMSLFCACSAPPNVGIGECDPKAINPAPDCLDAGTDADASDGDSSEPRTLARRPRIPAPTDAFRCRAATMPATGARSPTPSGSALPI